jgi:hypothetical protein
MIGSSEVILRPNFTRVNWITVGKSAYHPATRPAITATVHCPTIIQTRVLIGDRLRLPGDSLLSICKFFVRRCRHPTCSKGQRNRLE